MSDQFVWPGMAELERQAAENAIRETREQWLPELEEVRAGLAPETADLWTLVMLDAEIRRLRRLLGITPTDEERRAATRERVRQHRERKRQGIVLRQRRPPDTVESVIADSKRSADLYRHLHQLRRAGR